MKKPQKETERKLNPVSKPEISESQETQVFALSRLLNIIGYTQDTEISCDEVEQILDQFAELVQSGENAEEIMPLVKNHVSLCQECREEFDALLRILQNAS
jgi:hypothetical protein